MKYQQLNIDTNYEGGVKMGFCVVHMQKFKREDLRGMQSHNNREHKSKTNMDIDETRSDNNYDIVPCQNYTDAIQKRLDAVVKTKKAIRKDAVVLCNFVITSDNQTMTELGAEQQRDFFTNAVHWFADRYGSDKIVYATVHMDETTPHLHLGLVPITEDGRLCAKDLFDKIELKSIQTEFANDVGAKYGLERGLEDSGRKHLTETRYKLEKTQEQLVEAQTQVDKLKRTRKALKADVSVLKAERDKLYTQKELEALKGEKTLLGGLKGVTYQEFDKLKRTAQASEQISKDLTDLKQKYNDLIKKYKGNLADYEMLALRYNDTVDSIESLKAHYKEQVQIAIDMTSPSDSVKIGDLKKQIKKQKKQIDDLQYDLRQSDVISYTLMDTIKQLDPTIDLYELCQSAKKIVNNNIGENFGEVDEVGIDL